MTDNEPTLAPASRRAQRAAGRRRRLSGNDRIVVAALLGIPILLELALIWGPTIASAVLSFARWDGLSELTWIGTKNYTDIVSSYPPFDTAVRNNVLWLAFLGFVATPLGLFFAVLLDRELRFGRFYQSAIYLPVVLSLAVVGFIAQLVYSRDFGVLNTLLGRTDDPTDWLGNPDINIWAVLVAAGWRHIGYIMILYLAGLKAVDAGLKEAAAIDGANARQAFFYVIFPALRPVNIIVLAVTVIEALRAFDIVYAINAGRNGLELLSVLVTNNIVGEASRIGFGSAIAMILLAVSMVFILTYLIQILREEKR